MANDLTETLANLQEKEVLKQVRRGLDNGTDPQELLKACQLGMVTVGEKYEKSFYYVSDLMMAGEIFKGVSRLLSPHIKTSSGATRGKIVVGTVAGDIHDIGKDLVIGMLRANNFDIYDLGVDVRPDRFVEKVKETNARVLALSGLLTVAFDSMKKVISELNTEGLRNNLKIMVGGGPVNEGVCNYTGADGWGADAQAAVKLALKWIEG